VNIFIGVDCFDYYAFDSQAHADRDYILVGAVAHGPLLAFVVQSKHDVKFFD
jgi:hypothetical protein